MQLPYGVSAYKRNRGNLPALELVNMFVEQSTSDKKGVILQSRRGVAEVDDVGNGPVQAVLRKDGVFGGETFRISGGAAYAGSTFLGYVAGTGPAKIVASDIEVLFNAGGPIYSYNGSDFVEVDFPDAVDVRTIGFTAGYFIALKDGTDEWYFSAVDDGRSWDGLDFANAENEPDELRDLVVLDGVLVFLGSESVEFWGATGDADLPYAPIQQRVFEQGIIGTNCAVVVDNTIFAIGADKITYRYGDVPQAVSDDGIVERSAASATHELFLLTDERHKYLCQRHDTNTMILDVTTQQWCEFKSYGRDNFRVRAGFGDDETGKIWGWAEYTDNGGQLERLFMAGTELEAAAIISSIRLTCEVGTTSYLTGDYLNPVIEMRTSDDAGSTWSEWEAEELGQQGQYRWFPEWRALGMFDHPGFLAQWRVTDPVSFRLSGIDVNGSKGGRAI